MCAVRSYRPQNPPKLADQIGWNHCDRSGLSWQLWLFIQNWLLIFYHINCNFLISFIAKKLIWMRQKIHLFTLSSHLKYPFLCCVPCAVSEVAPTLPVSWQFPHSPLPHSLSWPPACARFTLPLKSTTLRNILDCTVLYWMNCSEIRSKMLHCIWLQCTLLHCTAVYFTVMHFTALHCILL